jgi:predicted phage terminase large subunit-like protein
MPEALDIVMTVRYWDKAGTEGGTGAYTAGVKMSKLKNGTYIVEDVKRGRWASEEREAIIKRCAESDGQKCYVAVEQEPGSGGKESAEATVRNLAGFVSSKDRPTGNKVFRADPYSVQVNNGNVKLLTGAWNKDYVDELKHFPNSTYKDQTDASSGAFAKLTSLKQAKVFKR